MAIDLSRRTRKRIAGKFGSRKECHSTDPYVKLLHQLYAFLARRTDSKFNKTVARRICLSNRNKPPMSLLRLAKHMKPHEGKVACIVGTVTDDARMSSSDFPKMTVCALHFTETARRRILAAGGECLTFDQLALRAPCGNGCVLLRGHTKSRLAERYFGRAPGLPGSHTRPRANPKKSH